MADDDTNLPDAYDLVPVDHQPQFADAPVPKAGQTIQQPNVMGDISSMPGKVASAVGDVTGISDAYKAATGQMTPEEAQMFALGALPMLAGGPEAKAVGEVASDIAPEVAKGIRAFHGSPYDFNAFDLSKIGTGEGAQAYGHGLYFAEAEPVAKEYRDALSRRMLSDSQQTDLAQYSFTAARGDTDKAIQRLQNEISMYDKKGWPSPDYRNQYDDAIAKLKAGNVQTPGHMYEVNINADPEHFLDWDKPLSEQHPKVQEALGSIDHPVVQAWQTNGAWPHATAQNLYDAIGGGRTNAAVAAGKTQNASEQLRDAGIPGIKYLDQGSRGNANYQILSPNDTVHGQWLVKQLPNGQVLYRGDDEAAARAAYASAPKPTSNYVVFNDKLIDIVKKYGLAGLVAGGASHFSTVPVDHQPDFPDQNGMADGGTVDDATDAPTDPTNSIAPLATALNQAVPNFDPEAAGFRPSTNIEDVRNKPLWRKAIETITRKPLPGDLTNYAKGGGVKATKTQANYRGGTANKRCGICSMFQPPRGCSAVRGVISPQALCDFYEPTKAEKKSDVKIDATHDGPWMSCMSIDGATMYRNKNIPATANIKGKTVDVDDMLLHHEVPEREDLEKLIAEFKARFKREPNTKERKGVYLKAHNRSGTPNERAHAKKIGVDWKAWSAWCRGEESKIEKMKFTNQPKDADVKPIPHSHDELEAMDHASAA